MTNADQVRYVLNPANDVTLQRIARASTDLASTLDLPFAASKLKGELEAVFNA